MREGNYRKALIHLQDLALQYPENIIFRYNQAWLYEKCNQLVKAEENYKQVLAMETDDLQLLKAKSCF